MTEACILVADVGGTNTRIALATDAGELRAIERTATPGADLADLLSDHLARHGATPRRAMLGVAGRVLRDGDRTRSSLTNIALALDSASLSDALGCPVTLHNDVAAVAAALPWLETSAFDLLGGPPPAPRLPRLAVGLGTGFGAALLTPGGTTVATEAGHVRPSRHLLLTLGLDDERPTIESILSGLGWRALLERNGEHGAAVRAFAAGLAETCADLALATGAWGGVHLFGGLHDHLKPSFDGAQLRAALVEDRGLWTDALRGLPLISIRDPWAALRGLARMADALD